MNTVRIEGEPQNMIRALEALQGTEVDVEILSPHLLALIGPVDEVLREVERIGGLLLHKVELFPASR